MCAPKGAAFLHVRREHQAMVHAPVISWGYSAHISQHAGIAQITGTTLLERRLQWQGTRDIAAFLTVPAAIAFLERHDWRALARRAHAMAWSCAQRVSRQTGLAPISERADCAQMVAMPVATSDPEALREALFDRYRIEVPVTGHRERHFVRVSVFAYNTEQDLDALVDAIAALTSGSGLPGSAGARPAQVESGH
jgi:isopenicillin-N epimerase